VNIKEMLARINAIARAARRRPDWIATNKKPPRGIAKEYLLTT
jgi:hypothetical protein